MSRTDKTAPWRVKAFFYPSFIEEHHNHENHVCDLPDRPTIDNLRWWGNVDPECTWVWSRRFVNHPLARCSCYMCGYDAYESIPRRKRQRIEGRKYCRDGWRDEY